MPGTADRLSCHGCRLACGSACSCWVRSGPCCHTSCLSAPARTPAAHLQRSQSRVAFRQPLFRHQSVRLDIARSRMELDAARWVGLPSPRACASRPLRLGRPSHAQLAATRLASCCGPPSLPVHSLLRPPPALCSHPQPQLPLLASSRHLMPQARPCPSPGWRCRMLHALRITPRSHLPPRPAASPPRRLVVLQAAHSLDQVGNKAARGEIAAAKALAPSAVLAILDRAIQVGRPMGKAGQATAPAPRQGRPSYPHTTRPSCCRCSDCPARHRVPPALQALQGVPPLRARPGPPRMGPLPSAPTCLCSATARRVAGARRRRRERRHASGAHVCGGAHPAPGRRPRHRPLGDHRQAGAGWRHAGTAVKTCVGGPAPVFLPTACCHQERAAMGCGLAAPGWGQARGSRTTGVPSPRELCCTHCKLDFP